MQFVSLRPLFSFSTSIINHVCLWFWIKRIYFQGKAKLVGHLSVNFNILQRKQFSLVKFWWNSSLRGIPAKNDISIVMWTDKVFFWLAWCGDELPGLQGFKCKGKCLLRGPKHSSPARANRLLPHLQMKNNTKKRAGEREAEAGSGERCLAGRREQDYTPMTFSLTRRKWRGSTGEEKLRRCTWEKCVINQSWSTDCWCCAGCGNRMWSGNKCGKLVESRPTAGRRWKEGKSKERKKKKKGAGAK